MDIKKCRLEFIERWKWEIFWEKNKIDFTLVNQIKKKVIYIKYFNFSYRREAIISLKNTKIK